MGKEGGRGCPLSCWHSVRFKRSTVCREGASLSSGNEVPLSARASAVAHYVPSHDSPSRAHCRGEGAVHFCNAESNRVGEGSGFTWKCADRNGDSGRKRQRDWRVWRQPRRDVPRSLLLRVCASTERVAEAADEWEAGEEDGPLSVHELRRRDYERALRDVSLPPSSER